MPGPSKTFKKRYRNVERAIAMDKAWRKRKAEDLRAYKKRWGKNNPEKLLLQNRKALIKRRYGMSLLDYDTLLIKQGRRCAICGSFNSGRNHGNGNFMIDHCHKTNKVRGLLCHKCNLGIGLFEDQLQLLKKAVSYLSKHRVFKLPPRRK